MPGPGQINRGILHRHQGNFCLRQSELVKKLLYLDITDHLYGEEIEVSKGQGWRAISGECYPGFMTHVTQCHELSFSKPESMGGD